MFGIPIDLPADATKADRDAYFEVWNKKYADQRKKAKAVNFGIPYGEGAEGLADQLGVPVQEAQSWLDAWSTKTFPVAAKWLARTVTESRKAGGVELQHGAVPQGSPASRPTSRRTRARGREPPGQEHANSGLPAL